jgi:hypothetical protein
MGIDCLTWMLSTLSLVRPATFESIIRRAAVNASYGEGFRDSFVAVHESVRGPFRRSPLCSDMSGVGAEAEAAGNALGRD